MRIITLTIIVLAACLSGMTLAQDEPVGLRDLADSHGLYIGAAVQSGLITSDRRYADTLSREFNLLTTEYETKMCIVQPTQGIYNFRPTDIMVDFAEEHNMVVRGHTLLWHECFPDWLTPASFTRDEAIDIMRDYIATLVGRYKGRIAIWDVVNEALTETGTLRNTQWRRLIGDDYIELAFRFAHEADPDALLFYNDYNAETLNRKSDAVYQLVQDLLANDVPIHGVGLQMHIRVGEVGPDRAIRPHALAENMQRLGDLGLEVHITEMDVTHSSLPDQSILDRQAFAYRTVLETCLSVEACTAFITWGFTDRHTWLRFYAANANPDAAPLLFDEDYQPKPAYDAVRTVLETFERDDD